MVCRFGSYGLKLVKLAILISIGGQLFSQPFNARAILLKKFNSAVAVLGGGDFLHCAVGAGKRRDAGNLVLDGGGADGIFVFDCVALCPRRVDGEVYLLVHDRGAEVFVILFTTSHFTQAFS